MAETTRETLLTPDDVAELLQAPNRRAVMTGTLRELLPWCKVGKKLRMHPGTLAKWIEAQQQAR